MGLKRAKVIWHLFCILLFLVSPLLSPVVVLPSFPFSLFLIQQLSPHLTIWTPKGKGVGHDECRMGRVLPISHVLQDVDAGRLEVAIWVLIAMVVVVFVAGNGAPHKCWPLHLRGDKCPKSSFLDLFLLWDLSLDLFVGTAFLVNLIELGAVFVSLLFFACLYLPSKWGKGLHLPAAGCWFSHMALPECVDSLPVLTINSTSIVSSGRTHWKNLKRKSNDGFISQAIVCKNI